MSKSATTVYSRYLYLLVISCFMLARSVCSSFKHSPFSPTFLRKNCMGLRMSSGIKNISAAEFNTILNSADRSSYQIIDVREKDELAQLALHGDDVINLPLSQNSVWGAQVIRGELLDANKPVLCMCKAGGRSMKAASFLGETCGFPCAFEIAPRST